jgi:hypothetical protein
VADRDDTTIHPATVDPTIGVRERMVVVDADTSIVERAVFARGW